MTRILRVDDNDTNLYLLSRVLESAGIEVLAARSDAAGVEMARSAVPDLILMDLNMPTIDGCEATRRIRAQPETGSIPVIALSPYDDVEHIALAEAIGCDDDLVKPLELRSLLGKIHALRAPEAPGPNAAS